MKSKIDFDNPSIHEAHCAKNADRQPWKWACSCKAQYEHEIKSAAQQLGQLGGRKTAEKHGKKHFSEAGKKGMAKRWGKLCKHEITIKYEKKYARTKCAACGRVVKPSQGYPLPKDFEQLTKIKL